MKIDRITFQKAFVTGPFLQEKLGMEILIDTANGETPEAAYTLAKQIVEQWHKASNPVIPSLSAADIGYGCLAPLPEVQPDREIGLRLNDILYCDDLKTLESYKFIVKQDKELERAYVVRYDQLKS